MKRKSTITKFTCSQLKGLSKGQSQLCHLYKDHIPFIARGAQMGINECQWQFKNQRWNCSTIDNTTAFGPLLNIGSREAAFTYSIASAGVVHAIATACRDGQLSKCGCSRSQRPKNLQKDWLWGGCGDNIEYGYRFAVTFIDVREKEKNQVKSYKDKSKKLMNLHNNEAGRRAVVRKTRITCKCHGVSGSCSLVTCWQQLPTFREVGDFLKEKYDSSVEVKITRRGKIKARNSKLKAPTTNDLVYVHESPDYCLGNSETGSIGTRGRVCNRTSNGVDGCSLMCCGRGYDTHRQLIKERCNCRFNWCCWVECQTCSVYKDIHTCK